jgi:hypothetical protein
MTLVENPKVSPRLMTQPPPQTHAATGKYTSVAQTPAKIIHAPNLARSAIAPEIRATVMIANVAPNVAPTSVSLSAFARPKSENGFPANAHELSTALMLNP